MSTKSPNADLKNVSDFNVNTCSVDTLFGKKTTEYMPTFTDSFMNTNSFVPEPKVRTIKNKKRPKSSGLFRPSKTSKVKISDQPYFNKKSLKERSVSRNNW